MRQSLIVGQIQKKSTKVKEKQTVGRSKEWKKKESESEREKRIIHVNLQK